MNDSDCDETAGTCVGADQAALIGHADGSFSVLVPYNETVDSRAHQLILAIALRLDDEAWIEEMIATLEGRYAREFGH